MVIYAEYLFIENGLAGFVILYLTKKLCGFNVHWIRLLIGSICCGLYAFVIFWDSLPWWGGLILKIGFSLGLVAGIFPCVSLRRLGQGTLIFYLVSFAMGGIVIGSMYFLNLTGITAGGAFYTGRITYIQVFLGMILTFIGLSTFASFLKERIWKGKNDISVKVSIGRKSSVLKGMVDSGNFLIDPITGKPVFLVAEKVIENLIPECGMLDIGISDEIRELGERFHLIPYKSVGREGGLLLGISPDEVLLLDKENKPRKVEIILAVYKGTFPAGWDGRKYDLLLHPGVMEGGILEGE